MAGDEIDTSPGWLMRALEADPGYQEICRRLREQEEVSPAEVNARTSQLLNPAEEPTLL